MPPAPADITARFENDLAEPALQGLIDEAVDQIESRFGPYVGVDPVTVTLPGRRRKIDVPRPIDTTQLGAVTIVEWIVIGDVWSDGSIDVDGQTSLDLDDTDWRQWNSGRTLQRLRTGTNPRVFWGERIDLTYQPVDDTKRRDEVVIKLCGLSLRYDGVIDQKVGDVSTTIGSRTTALPGQPAMPYHNEREALLASLQPRHSIFLR